MATHTVDNLTITLGDPVVVATSQPGEDRWGYHQFPKLSRMPGVDGRLLLTWNVCGDDDREYGHAGPAMVSADAGRTWQPFEYDAKAPEALLAVSHSPISHLPSGDALVTPFPLGHSPDELPADVTATPDSKFMAYAERNLYLLDRFPEWVRVYCSHLDGARYNAQTKQWEHTQVGWDISDALLRVWPGQSWVRTSFEQKLCELDGELFNADYKSFYRHPNGNLPTQMDTWCMVSSDGGRSFQRRALIATDADSDRIMGEGDITVTPDGELLCVIRQTDHRVLGMVITRSRDRGHTWTPFEPMFKGAYDFGVLPQLHTLEGGVIALVFGRPGVWLSFAADGKGATWTTPLPVIEGVPGDRPCHSCGYTNLVALDDDTFLLAYSDFQHPTADGERCKAIVVREVTVRR